MSYFATDLMGADEEDPTVERMREILQELEQAEDEHPDVSLNHESGWGISAFRDGRVIVENTETDSEPGHMVGLSRERILDLWIALSRGDFATLAKYPWRRGYPP